MFYYTGLWVFFRSLRKSGCIFTWIYPFFPRYQSKRSLLPVLGASFFASYFIYENLFHYHLYAASANVSSGAASAASTASFPKFILLSPSSEPYILVGLGARTITFLGIKVYVAGIYVPYSSLFKIRDVIQKHTLEASSNNNVQNLSTLMHDPVKSVLLISSFLESKIKFVIRIVPTRNTKFAHLRDGFSNRILNQLENKMEKCSSNDLVSFKSIWPTQRKLLKGDELLLSIIDTHTIRLIHNGQEIATFTGNDVIVKSILYSYLCGKYIISEEIRKNTIQGFVNLVLES